MREQKHEIKLSAVTYSQSIGNKERLLSHYKILQNLLSVKCCGVEEK